MNSYDNRYSQSRYSDYDRYKIGGTRSRKLNLFSIILSVVIGVALGLAIQYARGDLPYSILVTLSSIGGAVGGVLTYITSKILPVLIFAQSVGSSILNALEGVSKPALAEIIVLVVIITIAGSLLIPKFFPNGIPFLSQQPPSYLPPNGSLISNQLEVSERLTRGMRFSCYFDDADTYHVSEKGPGYFAWCKTQQIDFRNVAVVADIKLAREDYAGLFVRAQDSNLPSMYYCFIFPDGSYHLDMSQGQNYYVKKSGVIPGFKQGQTNTIALLAKGSKISLYVNAISVDSIDDDTYQDGTLGIISGNNSDVAFSNIQIWSYS